MRDRNTVKGVEAAHRRQLIAAGVLSPETMLLSGSVFPRSVCIGDVYMPLLRGTKDTLRSFTTSQQW